MESNIHILNYRVIFVSSLLAYYLKVSIKMVFFKRILEHKKEELLFPLHPPRMQLSSELIRIF